MIDGRPLSASEEAAYNGYGINSKSAFLPPPLALDRVELIRGPMSALHGSAAAGGVVNVITRGVADAWAGDVRLGFGAAQDSAAGSSKDAAFWFGGPLVQSRLALSVYGTVTDRHEDDRTEAFTRGQGLGAIRRSAYGTTLRWQPDDSQSLDFTLQHSRLDFSRSLLTSANDLEVGITDRNAALTYRFRWAQDFETLTFLQWERTDFRAGNESGHDAAIFSSRSTWGDELQNLTLGYEYRAETTRHDPDRLRTADGAKISRWHQSLFAEGLLPLGADAALTVGLRADHNERYGAALTPRAALVWHLTDRLTLKAGSGHGYKVPALKQADDGVAEPSGGNGRSLDLGNSRLRPESSISHEIGLVWNGESGAQMGITLFHTRFIDRISRVDLCRTPSGLAPSCEYEGANYIALTRYMNEDSARMNGVELTLDLPFETWDISANYTYSASRVTRGLNAGQPFHNLPQHVLNLSAEWYASERLSLWGNLQARSSVKAIGRSPAIPGHAIMDLGLSYEFNERLHGTVTVYNATDRVAGDVLPEGRRIHLGLQSSF